jgi:Flp pilus assembly protein TadD
MTPGASWEAWNALGVLADQSRDFEAADLAYSRAIGSAPDKAEIANNRGWSFMLRGDWQQAVVELERGHALDPSSKRIANNLELARAASAEALPLRLPSETDDEWAARLNDFGVVAMNKGDRDAAIAAFTQAIEARSVWFERAANNLKLAQSQ